MTNPAARTSLPEPSTLRPGTLLDDLSRKIWAEARAKIRLTRARGRWADLSLSDRTAVVKAQEELEAAEEARRKAYYLARVTWEDAVG
jgi:hypothetical protein